MIRMKNILAILGIILVFSLFLTGCNKQEETNKTDEVEGVADNLSDLDALEKELDNSDLEEFEQDLENFDW